MELQFIFDETNYNALPCRSKSHHERSTDPSYMTKKPGEMWDEKAQSTSTQILINMHFAEIFIQRLCDNI
ncbi:hypothetical protein, partial [Vibrio anguillarum]|uniref:hypothetical protein n=1 Tax=Vibrio anguillarum TaxID=55601 RepID=UPI001BE47526